MSNTIFSWPRRQHSSWTLAGCIFLMLFFHSSAFFIFQAALPGRSSAPRTAPPLQVLTPFAPDGSPSPENETLLRWLDAEDPAIIARVPAVEPPNLLDIQYRPSFATPRTPPLASPVEPATIQFPPARDPLSLILGSPAAGTEVPLPHVETQATRIEFSGALLLRAPKDTAFQPPAAATTPVVATRFLVGISAGGSVRYFFLQQPSGEQALDTAAAATLRLLKFTPAEHAAEAWGTATFRWGDDAMKKTE